MIQLIEEGNYVLLETKSQVKILRLGKKKTFAWIWVKDIGEILVSSYNPHTVDHLLSAGTYKVYDVKDESKLTDVYHLELEVGAGFWQGYLLLTGLPDKQKMRNRIIPTPQLITESKDLSLSP